MNKTYIPVRTSMPLWPHLRTERRIAELEAQRNFKVTEKEGKVDLGPKYPGMIAWLKRIAEKQKKGYDEWQAKKAAAIPAPTTTTEQS